MKRLVLILVVMMFASACSDDGIPQVTPTVAPTHTETVTPEATEPTNVAQVVPSRTPIFTATQTDAPTATASVTPTLTETLTATLSLTPNPSETATATSTETNTATPTFTATATDTPNPSETSTLTATFSPTATETPTITPNPSATETSTATDTPTTTLTFTPNPSETPTATLTLTNTLTSTVTATFTETVPPTATPLPTIGATSTPTPTDTPTITPSWTVTPQPTSTPLPPTPDLTEIALQFTETWQALEQTLTAEAPTPTPTDIDLTQVVLEFTLTMAAVNQTLTAEAPPPATIDAATPTSVVTLDVTPTFITAEAGTPPAQVTPITGDDTVVQFASETPTPAPTVANVPIFPTVPVNSLPPQPQFPSTNTGALGFVLTTGGGGVPASFNPLNNTNLVARNPVDPSQFLITNSSGVFFNVNSAGISRPDTSPFSRFEPGSPQDNQYFVSYIAWAPNGQYAAYIISGYQTHPDPTAEDGVHLFFPADSNSQQLLRDAPSTNHPGYQLGGTRQFLHASQTLEWSPDSSRILVRAVITDDAVRGQDRGVLMVLNLGQDPNSQPPNLRYDYGSWAIDGRIIVSGENGIGVVNADGSGYQAILNPNGFWYQHAVQNPNGTVYALGRAGGRLDNTPVAIYNGNGQAVTGAIGSTAPSRVAWSPDRSAVLVVTRDGRQYVANINGTVNDITSATGGAIPSWITGGLPAGAQQVGNGSTGGNGGTGGNAGGAIPGGVIEGSRYAPGQQLRVQRESLNIRDVPNLTTSTVIGGALFNEYVAILAGPVNADGIEWWQVQLANGVQGWIAGQIDGFDTLAP